MKNLSFCVKILVARPTGGTQPVDPPVDPPADPEFIPGDVNGDGRIKAQDYAMVKRFVLNTFDLSEVQQQRADANGDGKVTATDYAMIKRHVLGTFVIKGAEGK